MTTWFARGLARAGSLLCASILAMALGGCQSAPTSDPAPPPSAKPALRFGVLPATSASNARADYAVFTQRLEQLLKRPVELVIPKDYDALVDQIEKGEVDLAQLSAYLFVRVRPAIQGEVLVQQRMAWDTEYRGAFVVSDASKVRKLQDLKGKRIVYVDPQSSAGYFYPRMRLRQLGIDPDTFFAQATFAGSHERVVKMVQSGEADVGTLSEQTVPQGLSLRTIERSDVIPDDVIVAARNVTPEERVQLRELFLHAADDPKLNLFMNRRGVETYVKPDLEVFTPLEKEMGLTTTVTGTATGTAKAAATP